MFRLSGACHSNWRHSAVNISKRSLRESCSAALLSSLASSFQSWVSLRSSRRSCSSQPPMTPTGFSSRSSESRAAFDGKPVSYAPWEVRALLMPLVPVLSAECDTHSKVGRTWAPNVDEILRQLPKAVRLFLREQVKDKDVPHRGNSDEKVANSTTSTPRGLQNCLSVFLQTHFPDEFVEMPRGGLARRAAPHPTCSPQQLSASSTESRQGALGDLSESNPVPSREIHAEVIHGKVVESPLTSVLGAVPSSVGDGMPLSPALLFTSPPESVPTAVPAQNLKGTAPPLPPQPLGHGSRHAGPGVGAAAAGDESEGSATSHHVSSSSAVEAEEEDLDVLGPLRTPAQVMNVFVRYIPTYFVSVDTVALALPSTLKKVYADTSLRHYLKRMGHYLDFRALYGNSEVRLKLDFDHPKRGFADARYSGGGLASGDIATLKSLSRPPRNSEANLISLVAPQAPKEYTPLATVLQDLAPIISRHPAFDPRLGVVGLFGKYPEYFQLANGKLRARPYRSSPNSLDDRDATTSPLPNIFAKVLSCVEEAASGKDYSVPEEKAAAMVSTGRLYVMLTAAEKTQVKRECRSFPTFLRMHGKEIVVSADKMKVYKFVPENEACVETLLDERMRQNSLRPDDPVLKIPSTMPAESSADWAVKELYDALPLMQCAELDEVLTLVASAVREALPKDERAVVELLQQYSEYFTTWPYPDDPSIIIVQRAKVDVPALEKKEIVRMVLPLIPQGGTTVTSLRTRVPLVLQRYFHHHGALTTLGAMKDVFAISGDRIVRMM